MATANSTKPTTTALGFLQTASLENVISVQDDELNNIAALLHCAVDLAEQSDEVNTRLIRLMKMAIAKVDAMSVSFDPFVPEA